jgi:hypothetical protein
VSQTVKRLGVWLGVVLLVPLVAMQFTDQVDWDWHDFAIMGGALFSVGLVWELGARWTA